MLPYTRPATKLMDRFTFPVKFAILGGLFLVVIGVVLYNLFLNLNQTIIALQKEIDGIPVISQVSLTTQYLQQHRGLSAAKLGGTSTLAQRLVENEEKLASAFQKLEQLVPLNLKSEPEWQTIKQEFESIRTHGLSLKIADNFEKHTKLIYQLLDFTVRIGDNYGLTLDGEYDTYYLIDTAIQKLPQALEPLGQIRGYGSGILSAKQANPDQLLKMHMLIDESSIWLKFLTSNLAKTAQYTPSIRQSLLSSSHEINNASVEISNIVSREIFTRQFGMSPEEYFNITSRAIDKGYVELFDVLLPTAKMLLNHRMQALQTKLYITIGFALLLVSGAIYFFFGIYFSIIQSVRILTQSAARFSEGHLQERVALQTHDEMKAIGDSFNQVAAAFEHMAKELQESNKRLEQKVIERTQSLSLMASAFKNSGEACLITNAENLIVDVNLSFTKLTGYTLEEVKGKNPKILASDTTAKEIYEEMWDALRKHDCWEGELWDKHKDGHLYSKLLFISAVRDAEGKVVNYIGNFVDITKRKAAEEKIKFLAHHDSLTQLPNRFSLAERLSQAILSAERNQEKIAVMFIDMDRFKLINDTLGHDYGDQLLIQVAQRLQACARKSDIVARLGGDEFVVVINDAKNIDVISQFAEKILLSLGSEYIIGGKQLSSSPSIGIAIYPDHGTTAEQMMKYSDIAMYYAKQMGRNNLQFFDHSINTTSIEHLELENELCAGLQRNEFILYYQPQLSLTTGKVIGVEALVRWQHPARGLLLPEMFIPIAEESGLIFKLGDWILTTAIHQLKAFINAGLADVRMSINLTRLQFKQKHVVQIIEQAINHAGITDQSLIEFEISESTAMNQPEDAAKLIGQLRSIGVRFSIDDFGTGHSSLRYLNMFPVSCIKIDHSFVRDIETDPNDSALCKAIIAVAHSFDLSVIAEGVETQAQMDYLKKMQCDFIQGYYISQPLPAEQTIEFILAKSNF